MTNAAHEAYDRKGNRVNPAFVVANNFAPPAKIPGVLIYKRNHGTGHALRQMIYATALVDKIAAEGKGEGKDLALFVQQNDKIKSIIKLAAFCKRIGRTLDGEHDEKAEGPSIYSARSAQIFASIAGELGYERSLIAVIAESMLEPMPKKPSEAVRKASFGAFNGSALRYFSKNVLMAAHMADLVRLYSVERKYINQSLKAYFDDLDAVSTELVVMACRANEMTGNPVTLQPGIGFDSDHIYRQGLDQQKLVNTVTQFERTMNHLGHLKLSPLQKNPRKEQLPARKKSGLQGYEKEVLRLNGLFDELGLKAQGLRRCAKKNPGRYAAIAAEITGLHRDLAQLKQAFDHHPTRENLIVFCQSSIDKIRKIEESAQVHRGWHRVHPILRAIIGVLAIIVVIPAIVVDVKSKKGLFNGVFHSFFATPKTNTAEKLESLRDACESIANKASDKKLF